MASLVETFRKFYWDMNATRTFAKRPAEYIGKNKDYSRFIVLSHQRSGSSMVAWALGKHPEVLTFGELFVKRRIGHKVEGYDSHSPELLYLRERHPVRFLEEHAFPGYPSNIKAVGFKLFPDQVKSKATAPVMDWLVKDKEIKVISLTRENLLKVYCSLQIAQETGVFGIRRPSERQLVTMKIDVTAAETEFQKRIDYQRNARQALDGHRVLDLTYEQVVSNSEGAFSQMQQFLGVTEQPLAITSVKQETRGLSEIIENYDELRAAWKGTQWEAFL